MVQPPYGSSNSFWSKYGPRTVVFVVGVGLLVVLVLAASGSSGTVVNNTEVAIVVNNVTGAITLHQNGGMVMHLPLGLTSVYKVDKSQRVLRFARDKMTREHPQGEQIQLKTNDGTNVDIDVEVVYQVIPTQALQAFRELYQLDDEQNMEEILRTFVRSEVRNRFGELSTLEVVDPTTRNNKLSLVKQYLEENYKRLGVEIVSISALDFRFDPEYESIVKERKEADQMLINQKDYQDQAREQGKRMIAEGTRDRETAIAQLKGELAKQELTAEGEAKRTIVKAQQEAYQLDREGELAVQTAEQEAAAVRAEGEKKAEGMEKLFEAYEKGGEGMVKEALAKLYEGVSIRAHPYSESDRVEQYRSVPGAAVKGK